MTHQRHHHQLLYLKNSVQQMFKFFFFHSYTISKLCTGLNSKQLRSNVVYDARLQNALYIQGWRQD